MYVWVHFVVNVCMWFVVFSEDASLNLFEKMDRNWMTKPRTSLEYQRGVDKFLEHAAQNVGVGNRIYCPFLRCGNKSLQLVKDVKDHLYFNSINSSY